MGCLAATQGQYKPPREWIQGRIDVIQDSRFLMDSARAVALLVRMSDLAVPAADIPAVLMEATAEVRKAFLELFFIRGSNVDCLHPLYAQILLELTDKLNFSASSGKLDCASLLALWQGPIKSFFSVRTAKQFRGRFLCRRTDGNLFSAFISQFVAQDDEEATKAILLAEDEDPHLVLLLSRCFRAFAQNAPDNSEYGHYALQYAAKASSDLEGDPYELLGKANLACMEANFGSPTKG